MKLLQNIPPYLFLLARWCRKTSISCATAIHLAEQVSGFCWSVPTRPPMSVRYSIWLSVTRFALTAVPGFLLWRLTRRKPLAISGQNR